VKKIFIILFFGLFVFNVLGYSYSENEQKDYELILDNSIIGDSKLTAAWLAYGGTRGFWYEEEFFQQYPNENNYRYTFHEELEARRSLAQVWHELSQEDSSIQDKYLDELVVVCKNGYIKEYVLLYFKQTYWKVDEDSLRMNEFISWAEDNIPNHNLKTLAIIESK